MGAPPDFLRQIQVHGTGTREWLIHHAMEPQLTHSQLEAVGWVEAQTGFEIVRPLSRQAMLFACVDGEGDVWQQGQWHRCKAGSAYLAPIGQSCAYRALPHSSWHCCWILCHDGGPISVPAPTLVLADAHRLHTAIEGLYEESTGPGEPSVIRNWIELIVTLTYRISYPEARRRSRLRPLWTAVTANMCHPWSLADLTRKAGVSEETLRQLCHQEYGRSPMEQVTYLRLRYAASLLVSTSLAVSDVASQVGYRNPFAFSTAFKRVFGAPPSRYGRAGTTAPRMTEE